MCQCFDIQDDVDQDGGAEVGGEVAADPRRYIPSVMISTGQMLRARLGQSALVGVCCTHEEASLSIDQAYQLR